MKKLVSLLFLLECTTLLSQYSDYRSPVLHLSFLEINTNARIGGFGDIGAVSSGFYSDINTHQNPALLSKAGKYAGGSISYMPWLKATGFSLSYFEHNGFYSFDTKNAIGFRFKRFSLGTVYMTDELGNLSKTVKPVEFSYKFSYSRKIKALSAGMGLKYIRSNLTGYTEQDESPYKPINTFAIDIGAAYHTQIAILTNSFLNFDFGGSISNFGPKVSEKEETDKKFIPTCLGMGILVNPDFYLTDNLRFNIDVAYQSDKLLVPSLPVYDESNDSVIVAGMDPDISPFKALYQSFYDAPGGFREETHEFIHKIGTEFRLNYDRISYFAVRYGRFMEHETKGNRNYNTFGIGAGLYGFTFDFKIMGTDNSYLNGTWALTIGFRTNLDELFRF